MNGILTKPDRISRFGLCGLLSFLTLSIVTLAHLLTRATMSECANEINDLVCASANPWIAALSYLAFLPAIAAFVVMALPDRALVLKPDDT